jgi:hypothetical protein
MALTTEKTAPGEFMVFWNGEKTAYGIVNGSRGFVGCGAKNTYGIVSGSSPVRWIGTLQACKSILAVTLAAKG